MVVDMTRSRTSITVSADGLRFYRDHAAAHGLTVSDLVHLAVHHHAAYCGVESSAIERPNNGAPDVQLTPSTT